MSNELQIISRSYDLLKWTIEHTAKFDRKHRHGVGMRLENRLHELIDALQEAKYAHQKDDALSVAGIRLEQARLLFRLAKDVHLLAINSYGHASEVLADIAGQLAAWRHSLGRKL